MVQLILGTAQLGLDYGATNEFGRPNDKEASKLLTAAKSSKITTLDTAAAYGDAEDRLGQLCRHDEFEVITKFAAKNNQFEPLENHFARLGRGRLSGILFHNSSDIFSSIGKARVAELLELREKGLVSQIGVSAYTLDEIASSMKVFPSLNLIQIPANILDMKLLNSSLICELVDSGVEIHVRSVFLQGLLLKSHFTLQEKFEELREPIRKLDELANNQGASRMSIIFTHIKRHRNVSAVVVGTSSSNELEEIVQSWDSEVELGDYFPDFGIDSNLLDPRNW